MPKLIKTLGLILILMQVIVGQPASPVWAGNSGLKTEVSDSLHYLNLPERPENAVSGEAFARRVAGLSLDDREKAVVREILSGNVPSFSRKLRAVSVTQTINARRYTVTFFVACDYMAIGSDQNYLYMPMTPSTAQYLANRLHCTLPTKKMVDIIYRKAEIKLRPQPIPPSDKMTTVPVFLQHTDSIRQQIAQLGFDRSGDAMIAGHKKDIIISNKIYSPDRNYPRVVIYGWHLSENHPIQPVYNGHIARYADYSHGVRLISKGAYLNGDSTQIDALLKDPRLWKLLSDEGVIPRPYYPVSDIFTIMEEFFENFRIDFKLNQNYPNPFNGTTRINYQLSKNLAVDLSIFDMLGQKVTTLVSGEQPAGDYSIEWNALSCANGVYIYQLKAGPFEKSRKMILLK
ncbi:MAG: T9SS type A sorting domain-containing protein [Calditrichaeota bacterium]|nr:T9SS type A sorting domain-containing protein [Calditrichota bacterium]